MSYFTRKPVPLSITSELANRNGNYKPGEPNIRVTSLCDKCELQLPDMANSMSSQNVQDYYANQKKSQAIKSTNTPNSTLLATVTELKVVKQGELGTTRKATIQIECANNETLNKLSACYFIPGMSVRIQWGYGTNFKYPTPTTPTTVLNADAVNAMQDHTAKYPLTEGMQGLVSNFGYTYNVEQKKWQCFIEVISATTGGKTSEPDCILKPCYVKKTGDEGQKDKQVALDYTQIKLTAIAAKGKNLSTLGIVAVGVVGVAAGVFVVATLGTGAIAIGVAAAAATVAAGATTAAAGVTSLTTAGNIGSDDMWESVFQYEGDTRDPLDNGKADGGFWSSTMGTGTNEAYLSFGKLLNLLDSVYHSSKDFTQFQKSLPLPKVDNIGCSDARICFIPGVKHLEHLLDDYTPSQVPSALNENNQVIVEKIAVNAIHALMVYTEMLAAAKEDADNTNNHKVNIEEYVNRILNDINTSCGNPYTDLRLGQNDKGQYEVVTDESTGGGNEVEAYSLPVGPGTFVIQDLKLELKLTGAMKTQALYGSNESMTAEKCTESSFSAFGLSSGKFKNLGFPDPVEPIPCPDEASSKDAECESQPTSTMELYEDAGDGHSTSTCANLASRLSDVYNGKVNADTGEPIDPTNAPKASCSNIPLPFEMNFALTFGIGGLGFGQVITCDLVPPEVKKSFEFQILNVDHTINKSGWITSVTTVARTKPAVQNNG